MKKLLLLDGNSMLFRAFYATIYTRPMKTSSNIPTNAIYAFATMLQKAIEIVNPDSIFVAWDSGKPTFRHELNPDYKGTRKQLPEELMAQFPIAREFLDAANIYQYEKEGIEADDIIGSIAKKYRDFEVVVLTSDRDLLQLIDDRIKIMLMKKGMSEIETIDEAALKAWMAITPQQVVDLKALMGDTADNIKGVAGIGEKTAVKLIHQFQTIENLYEHLSLLKGKQLEKLIEGKESAFLSKKLATIITDATLEFDTSLWQYQVNQTSLNAFYRKYEMKSLIKEKEKKATIDLKIVETIDKTICNEQTMILLQYDHEHYLEKKLIGLTVSNFEKAEFITCENLKKDTKFLDFLMHNALTTLNAKTAYHVFENEGIQVKDFTDDVLLMGFLIDNAVSDYEKLVTQFSLNMHASSESIFGKKGKTNTIVVEEHMDYFKQELENVEKIYPILKSKIKENALEHLYQTIELPLTKVLYRMERRGVYTDKKVLAEISEKTLKIIDQLTAEIYEVVGMTFNVNSPKQLGEILFDTLGLKAGKKRSTAIDVLEKLQNAHPVIPLIIQQRKYQKLYSTYSQGLMKHILADHKIHTTYNQLITATGRLSSVDPNLQNISAKDEEAKEIRKAFTASPNHVLLSFDYSQIELRIVAHMANEKNMIEDFNQGLDIHASTAKKIFNREEITDLERRFAKAVNFGILYGMSEFGLSQQLNISLKEAKQFIEKYFATYPNIQKFMQSQVDFCVAHGYVETLFKRRREIPDIHHSNKMIVEFAKRAAMNTPIQGSAADIIKLAMIEIEKVLENYQSKMILQVHDELIFDCVLEEKNEIYDLIEKVMSNVVQLDVKLVVDGKFGENYYDTK